MRSDLKAAADAVSPERTMLPDVELGRRRYGGAVVVLWCHCLCVLKILNIMEKVEPVNDCASLFRLSARLPERFSRYKRWRKSTTEQLGSHGIIGAFPPRDATLPACRCGRIAGQLVSNLCEGRDYVSMDGCYPV